MQQDVSLFNGVVESTADPVLGVLRFYESGEGPSSPAAVFGAIVAGRCTTTTTTTTATCMSTQFV